MNFLNCNGHLLKLEEPLVMGVLNITPDSFYDGGRYVEQETALQQVEEMIAEGATIIDIGGMSSRPGAKLIDAKEEESRVLPIIKVVKKRFPDAIISVDTVRSTVAKRAIEAGASMINDISGGKIDEEIWMVAKQNKVPYILMHMQGTPETMQINPQYENVVLDILTSLRDRVFRLRDLGVQDVIIDPGFGFGKSLDQNYQLLANLSAFKILDCPILAGLSRKSMICKLLGVSPKEALNGTSAAHMIALQNGAKILRVHDVKEAIQCVKIFHQWNKNK